MSEPLVTAMVCVYNAGAFLRPSIQSLLSQTYRSLEILIIDDGSTDGCLDSIRDLEGDRIRILRQKNQGKSVALNVGLEQMRGEFYAIHDADDLSHPLRVERQLACLSAHADVAAVYSGYDVLLGTARMAPLCRAKSADDCRKDILAFRMPSHDPTGMYRRSLVRDLRYDPELRIGQGLDYILRVGEQFPMMVLEECLYSYRIHRGSNTKRDPALRQRMVERVMQKARERRGMAPVSTLSAASGERHRVRDNNLAAHFIESVCTQRERGRRVGALKAGFQCLALHPGDAHYWKALVYAAMPGAVLRRIRLARTSAACS